MKVGHYDTGTLNVEAGGSVSNTTGYVGYSSSGNGCDGHGNRFELG